MEKKKVLLIYPPSGIMNREDRCQQPVKELIVIPPLPPTDLLYMAAIAERAGCIAMVKDYSLDAQTGIDLVRDINEFKPDYLVINVTTPTVKTDLQYCTIAKEILPELKIIAKGAHFLTFAEETLKAFPNLDYAIKGEPELTLEELLNGKEINEIQGLIWRNSDEIVTNPVRPFNDNLDALPYPARHLVDNSRFRRPDNNKMQAVIKVSRGCPYHCFFCLATPVAGTKVRVRSPQNILGEIRECIEKYKIRDFIFWSDIFNFDRKWAVELCEAIIASGLKFTWAANTRADTADLELARLMYKAGCRLVSIGVESGNQEMLDKMGKKTTLEQIRQTVRDFKKAGMKVYNYFVIGLPWESEQTVEDTINFAIELDSDFINFYTAVAFPGTKFYNYVQENSLTDSSNMLELFNDIYYYPVTRSHHLSKERIFELHKKAVKKFYLRPKFILKTLLSIRSINEFKNYAKAALAILQKND